MIFILLKNEVKGNVTTIVEDKPLRFELESLACFKNWQFDLTVYEFRISLKCSDIKDCRTSFGLKV